MNIRNHIKAFLFGTTVWIAFFILGLPNYFQQYSTTFMALFDIAVFPFLVAMVLLIMKWLKGKSSSNKSVLLAFYGTVPLFVYDYLYCGIYLQHGWEFLSTYWYLTIYYFIPWIVLPLMGIYLDKRNQRKISNQT
jgi:hypothetical protein